MQIKRGPRMSGNHLRRKRFHSASLFSAVLVRFCRSGALPNDPAIYCWHVRVGTLRDLVSRGRKLLKKFGLLFKKHTRVWEGLSFTYSQPRQRNGLENKTEFPEA